MECISKIRIKVPEVGYMDVNCGKCNFCLQRRRKEWEFRLMEHNRTCLNSWFVTLTYDDNNTVVTNWGELTLVRKHLTGFLQDLRNESIRHWSKMGYNRDNYPKMKYYAVGEYGTNTDRPHYHAIIFNVPALLIDQLHWTWKRGQTQTGDVNAKSISYVCKYLINKDYGDTDREPTFAIMSKGLGLNYVTLNKTYHEENEKITVRSSGGILQMPRYIKQKVFTQGKARTLAEKAYFEQAKKLVEEKAKKLKQGWKAAELERYEEDQRKKLHDAIKNKSNFNLKI